MFGRDLWLPINRPVEMEETPGHQPSSWITKHQTELRDTHQRAAARLAKEADTRKKRFDRHSRTKVPPIEVGRRVLVRDHIIRGRNKIQDQCSTRVHKVVKLLDNGAYVIKPAVGHGSTRVVNQAELQVCRLSVLQRTPEWMRQRISKEPQQAYSSDYDSHVGISIDIVPPPCGTAEPDIDVTSSDGNFDGSIADDSGTDNELSVRPVRCSTRSTAGHHSNRYNLPMSVLKK